MNFTTILLIILILLLNYLNTKAKSNSLLIVLNSIKIMSK
jgi:hypothetical protein